MTELVRRGHPILLVYTPHWLQTTIIPHISAESQFITLLVKLKKIVYLLQKLNNPYLHCGCEFKEMSAGQVSLGRLHPVNMSEGQVSLWGLHPEDMSEGQVSRWGLHPENMSGLLYTTDAADE